MYKLFLGVVSGIALTLAATQVFQATRTEPEPQSPQIASAAAVGLEQSVQQIASELALLRASFDGLNARFDDLEVADHHQAEYMAQGPAVTAPRETGAERPDTMLDPQELALHKEDALHRLSDPGMTLPDFMASAELGELPPEAQDEVMQELVRRFNSGEIDREQFVPGYTY